MVNTTHKTPRTDKELLSSDCTYNCGHSFKYLRDEKRIDGKCVETGPDIAHGNGGVVVLADFARQLERENARLRDIIRRASTKFCDDGADGVIAAAMFSILGEASKPNEKLTQDAPTTT